MKELTKSDNWVSGLQWLFFIFANIVVIPITIGAAFDLSDNQIASLLHLSFIVTGLACVLQGLLGHRRAILEGQSGLWWGVILILVSTASSQGIALSVLGGSLAVGVILSGVMTMLIGFLGLGPSLAKLFNSSVMGTFMFLFGCQLVGLFLKGMLGIPFGHDSQTAKIDIPISVVSIVIVIIVILLNVKGSRHLRKYSLLIGIFIGWFLFTVIIGAPFSLDTASLLQVELFPLGRPSWHVGIIITVVLTGLLNLANTFGAIKGTDDMYPHAIRNKDYRNHFAINGICTTIAGFLGLVPYAPYVSSIGFLKQTEDYRRTPFILGGLMFLLVGIIPTVGDFFALMPLSVGSAVLFVAYLQLFHASLDFFKKVCLNTKNVYRIAIPVFTGIIIMTLPQGYFDSLPGIVRPLISNGLLIGIMLALLLENVFSWEPSNHSLDNNG